MDSLDAEVRQPERFLPWLVARLKRIDEIRELWARRRRERDQLLRLNDYLLRDIGMHRYEAEVEARKPFWRA